MPLVRIPAAFDHSDWLFELKYDGFRALAIVEGHTCRLVSRRGHEFTKFTLLSSAPSIAPSASPKFLCSSGVTT
jgi:ATP-dependent DNA ligase